MIDMKTEHKTAMFAVMAIGLMMVAGGGDIDILGWYGWYGC